MASPGFSILAWVNPESPLLMGLDPRSSAYDEMQDELLGDAQVLWGCKWGMDFTKITGLDNCRFLHGNNLRFVASNETIKQCLGNLAEHVYFLRSTPNITPEDLIKYKNCLKKWKVPTPDTTSSSGPDAKERPGTSHSSRYRPY